MTIRDTVLVGVVVGVALGMTINYFYAREARDDYHFTVCQLQMHRLRDTLGVIRADRFCLRLIKESR